MAHESSKGQLPDTIEKITIRQGQGPAGTVADSSAICAFLSKRHNADPYCADAFDTGQVVWLEEYADKVLAIPVGMNIFRPIMLPRFAGGESDLETARKTWKEDLPPVFDYLEATLDGHDYFVGERYSVADIAIGCQMTQLDFVAATPDANRWPSLVKHTLAIKQKPGIAENLETCRKMLGRILPEPFDLS